MTTCDGERVFETHVTYPYLLKPGSGVAIEALTTGGYMIVFQGSDGLVYKMAGRRRVAGPRRPVSRVGDGIAMAGDTRPAIALGNTGYEIAVHGANDTWARRPGQCRPRHGPGDRRGHQPGHRRATGSQPAAPDLSPVQATTNSYVTVGWNDNSTNEYQFVLAKAQHRRRRNGWGDIYSTDSDNPAGTFAASEYQYTDFDTGPDAECYRVLAIPVVATSGFGNGVSDERCTVRPDPAQFPQSVPLSADQWDTFSASPCPRPSTAPPSMT